MKKNGFTLIELLAVIVILAIIALIATPMILNVIEEAKKEATERSVENIEKAANLYYYENKLNGSFLETRFICKEGECSNESGILNIGGKAPESGSITITKDGEVSLNSIVISGYSCYKVNDRYTCEKTNKTSNETDNGILTLNNSKTTTLSNYIIKGNSVQETNKSRNLANPKLIENYVNSMQLAGYPSTKIMLTEEGRKILSIVSEDAYGHENYNDLVQIFYGIFKEKTQYTISFDFYKDDNEEMMNLQIKYTDGSTKNFNYSSLVSDQIYHFIYTSEADKTIESISKVYYSGTTYIYLDTLQIEEGTQATDYEEYVVKPSPEFPSEIKSVGDLVTNQSDLNYGKYKIPIRVTGKNLARNDSPKNPDLNYKSSGGGTTVIKYSVENDGYYTEGHRTRSFGVLMPGTYTFSFSAKLNTDGTSRYVILTKDHAGYGFNILSKTALTNEYKRYSYSFTLNEAKEFYITIYDALYFKDIQLEKDSIKTEYEPYKEEVFNIYLDEPLRCIENVCDYIEFEKQKIVRNIYKDNLATIATGKYVGKSTALASNSFYVTTPYSDGLLNLKPNIFLWNESSWKFQPNILADKLPAISLETMYEDNNIYGICASENERKTNNQIRIALPSSVATTVSEFKKWLKANDSNIYYVMLNSEEESLKLPQININKGVSNIFVETNIKPSEFIVDYYN